MTYRDKDITTENSKEVKCYLKECFLCREQLVCVFCVICFNGYIIKNSYPVCVYVDKLWDFPRLKNFSKPGVLMGSPLHKISSHALYIFNALSVFCDGTALITVLFVYSTHKNGHPSVVSNLIIQFVYPNPFYIMQFLFAFLTGRKEMNFRDESCGQKFLSDAANN